MQVLGTWSGGFRTVLDDGRTHTVTVDFSREEGGESSGTSALELALMSLAGCITSIFAVVARKRRIDVHSMTIGLEAERPRGAPTITGVRGTLRIRSSAPEEEIATVLRLTVRTCPVGVIFERANIPVEVVPIIERP